MPSEDADGPSAVPYSIAGGEGAQSVPPLLSAMSALPALPAPPVAPAPPGWPAAQPPTRTRIRARRSAER
jgi:hypothetical protein